MMAMGAMLSPDFSAMPAELRRIPRWVLWKGAKVPYCPTAKNSKASVTEPDTWASFDQAQTAYEEGGYQGVGFVLSGDGIVGVDLDKCIHSGEPDPAALDLLDRVGCGYVELSPSGTGLRGFGYGDNITGRRGQIDGVNVELYASKRYLTVTGRLLVPGPLVKLLGFSEVANAIRSPDLQKKTEDDRSNLLFSSVGIPPSTLPAQVGQRNRCLFELARYLRGRIPQASREELRALVMTWHDLALPVIGTKDFAITWADFMNGWEKVQKPFGSTMQTINATIDHSAPLPIGLDALGYGEPCKRLVRLCIALQVHQGFEPFFISARQAGEQLGMHFSDAAKMLRALVADKVLEEVSKGAGKVASRYRFIWK
jgi:hypothetical protein